MDRIALEDVDRDDNNANNNGGRNHRQNHKSIDAPAGLPCDVIEEDQDCQTRECGRKPENDLGPPGDYQGLLDSFDADVPDVPILSLC